jgi:hypothetical protein
MGRPEFVSLFVCHCLDFLKKSALFAGSNPVAPTISSNRFPGDLPGQTATFT